MANTPTLLASISQDPSTLAPNIAGFISAINTLDQRTAGLNTSGVPTSPAPVPTYTLLTLPTAATYPGFLIRVSNASTPNTLCVSDGVNWKVVTLGATVS